VEYVGIGFDYWKMHITWASAHLAGSQQQKELHMGKIEAPLLAIAFFVSVFAFTAVASGQERVAASDINQYRPYFIKQSDDELKKGSIKVTFLGATTLLFDDGESQLMLDGFFTRPSLFRLIKNIETDTKAVDAALKRAKVDRLKALFVAHSHYDHAFDVAYVIQKTNARLYGSSSTLNVGRGGDLKEDQMVLFEERKEFKVGQFSVTVLKSKHSPPIKGINDDLGQTIDKPLRQPASAKDYKEGGTFDFLIKHGGKAILVNSSNYIQDARNDVRADVVFLSTGSLGDQTKEFQDVFYSQTIVKVRPKLVIPIHWDNFFMPLSDHLVGMDDLNASFDFLIDRLKTDKIEFGILQGYQSVTLFAKESDAKK
jgi:L-ascorbate metabolism protein UlaG (beta-lactamase superfamily)